MTSRKCLLVTGSSGYIGHNLMIKLKTLTDIDTIGIDIVPSEHTHIICNMIDKAELLNVFKLNPPDFVIHLAALIQVGESELKPAKYWQYNFIATLNLLEVIRDISPDTKLIFMSSAAVYGPSKEGLTETSETKPTSVYGQTKLACEMAILSYSKAYDLKAVILRLFNAGGGVRNPNKTFHLIPLALKYLKEDRNFQIFGSDYDTSDGTCVRSYVHVKDIIKACLNSMVLLDNDDKNCHIFNVSPKQAYTILEVLRKIEEVTEQKLRWDYTERRPGDPDNLIGVTNKNFDVHICNSEMLTLTDIIKDEWKSINSVSY